jgi:putative drug exporter of the RND superfamily
MSVAGDRAWWLPCCLDRILPNLDVEGEALMQQLEAGDSTSATTSGPPEREAELVGSNA